MRFNKLYGTSLFLGILAATVIGCGGGGPKKVPVTVTVNHNGQPVAETRVNLMASDGSVSFATTDADGKASDFITDSPGDGVPLGSYKVTLAVPPAPVDEEITDASAYAITPPSDLPFPRKYVNDSSSDLSVEVTDDKTDFTLELTD